MAWDILLKHPFTNASVGTGSIALGDATVHRAASGDSVEAEIVVAPETMPEHVRHNLTLRRDTVAKFYGMITRPVNRNIEDQDLTLNIAGIRKRLYEHPMTESYVPGGDVGAMVTSVLSNALNIPVGLSFGGGVPTFGFVLGDRVTKRSESVGDFLDAMAQAVPGFVVPPAGAEYTQMIAAFPEMASFSTGDVVLGAVWGVEPSGAIFFSRRDTTNSSLVEGTNCFIYEQETFDAENIVTSIRWIIDRINLQGHAIKTGYKTESSSTEQGRLNKIRVNSVTATLTPIIISKTFNFNQDTAEAGALAGLPISNIFGLGEVISYDAPNISLRNKYGLAYDVFQLSDYEPAFKALAIAANWVVVKGNLLTGAMADLKTGVDPITVTTNVEGYFVMSLDIADITLYDGFYINAPDAEVAWYLYNIPSLPSDAFDYVAPGQYHEIPIESQGKLSNGATQRINLFSKKALLDADLTNPSTATKRLTVTMKFTNRDGVGNFFDYDFSSGFPAFIDLLNGVPFEYTLKEGETIEFFGTLAPDGITALANAVTATLNTVTTALPFVAVPGDVVTFEQTAVATQEMKVIIHQRRTVYLPEDFNVRLIEPILDSEQSLSRVSVIPHNSAYTTVLTYPITITASEKAYLQIYNFYESSVKVRIYGTPTIERTIYGAYLVEKDTGYLRRIAQNLYKTPVDNNLTIVCNDFVDPTRRLDIAGRGVLFPTKFEDRYIDEDYYTVITIGQPENADEEAMQKLIDERAKSKQKELDP
jgi:hypothetical protein